MPCGARLRQLAFGTVDYTPEPRLEGPMGEQAVGHARHVLVAASRAAGLHPPIGGVMLADRDADATGRHAARARALGFGGKLAIHLAQVEPICRAARPNAAHLDWARAVVDAFTTAEARGVDTILVRDRLVDRPIVLQVQRVSEQAVP